MPSFLANHLMYVYAAAGAVVALLLLYWVASRFVRKRLVVLRRSEVTEQLEYQLGRIADALERLSPQQFTPFQSSEQPKRHAGVGSLFGQ